ncbi:FadR/GntR family transcriptional regulator [Actinomadura verrucosospora]|uniref:GntR family transcriptional regulator n=1 Tax=Actinomadura verrucosospora TaxID=46165 RepID=A0A7D3VRW3_ACTVE|nr:FCD domain-containing protein [Actinomadura verrucosospora]QKG21030.1 GntR family transcriptional regulator [Actinomadura verrucosospora]
MTAARTRGRATRGRSSRTEEVQQAVKQLILERGLASGDPMPTEFELVEELDVSRNSLREALKALQAVGIVEIRHGFGMYVGSMSLGALVDELTFHARMSKRQGRDDLAHLVDVREVLERGLVEQVIDRGLASDTAELDEIMRRMDAEAAAGQVTPETDRLFHELLYRPLANPIVNQLLGAFWDVYRTLQHDLAPVRQEAADVAQRHRDIYEALVSGDRSAAATAMAAHFRGIRERLDAAHDDSGA